MPFKKGDSNINTKGRKKNVKNKNTATLKHLITSALTDTYNKFLNELDSLKGRDFVNAYTNLLKYNLPTLKATEITEPKKNDYNNAKEIQIEIIHSNHNNN